MNPLIKQSMITVGRILPDELYLKTIFLLYAGKRLNLSHPQTYNEKVNWLKLHDRNPLYTQMVDKKAARALVAQKIGEAYLPKLYGCWENFDDMDFDQLPLVLCSSVRMIPAVWLFVRINLRLISGRLKGSCLPTCGEMLFITRGNGRIRTWSRASSQRSCWSMGHTRCCPFTNFSVSTGK